MSSTMEWGLHMTASAARFAWYYGINQLVDAQARRLGQRPRYRARRPVPSEREMLVELGRLMLSDADDVRRGLSPALAQPPGGLPRHIGRLRAMFQDLPGTLARRASENAASVRELAETASVAVPDYYAQDFHFQTGGYLSEHSARLYDVQVETLFYGSADLMRRRALPPIARAIAGRDQRNVRLLDVACGTGRLLRQLRLSWPAMRLTGLDLTQAYLDEAGRHMKPLRPAGLIAANAEAIPLADASQDIVTCVFLYHELPPEVRRRISAEIARVLQPGGLLVWIDSLQMGDRPDWDGLLETFPMRFHEPYFRHYAIDDLDAMLTEAGLADESRELAFLSKMLVRRKIG